MLWAYKQLEIQFCIDFVTKPPAIFMSKLRFLLKHATISNLFIYIILGLNLKYKNFISRYFRLKFPWKISYLFTFEIPFWPCIIIMQLFLLGFCSSTLHNQKYEQLIKDLLNTSRHDKRVRPVDNPSKAINVTMALALHFIENLVGFEFDDK